MFISVSHFLDFLFLIFLILYLGCIKVMVPTCRLVVSTGNNCTNVYRQIRKKMYIYHKSINSNLTINLSKGKSNKIN